MQHATAPGTLLTHVVSRGVRGGRHFERPMLTGVPLPTLVLGLHSAKLTSHCTRHRSYTRELTGATTHTSTARHGWHSCWYADAGPTLCRVDGAAGLAGTLSMARLRAVSAVARSQSQVAGGCPSGASGAADEPAAGVQQRVAATAWVQAACRLSLRVAVALVVAVATLVGGRLDSCAGVAGGGVPGGQLLLGVGTALEGCECRGCYRGGSGAAYRVVCLQYLAVGRPTVGWRQLQLGLPAPGVVPGP